MRTLLLIAILLCPGISLADGKATYTTVTLVTSSSRSDGVSHSLTLPDGACYLYLAGGIESRGNENFGGDPDAEMIFDSGGSNEVDLLQTPTGSSDGGGSGNQLAAMAGNFFGVEVTGGDIIETMSYQWNDGNQVQQAGWTLLIENAGNAAPLDVCVAVDTSGSDDNPKCSGTSSDTNSIIVWAAGGRGHDTTPVSSYETDSVGMIDADTCSPTCGSIGADDGVMSGYVDADDHTTASKSYGATMAVADDWAIMVVEVRPRAVGECSAGATRRIMLISKILEWFGIPDPEEVKREYFSKPRVIASASSNGGEQRWFGRFSHRNQSP